MPWPVEPWVSARPPCSHKLLVSTCASLRVRTNTVASTPRKCSKASKRTALTIQDMELGRAGLPSLQMGAASAAREAFQARSECAV